MTDWLTIEKTLDGTIEVEDGDSPDTFTILSKLNRPPTLDEVRANRELGDAALDLVAGRRFVRHAVQINREVSSYIRDDDPTLASFSELKRVLYEISELAKKRNERIERNLQRATKEMARVRAGRLSWEEK